ncbi:MAG: argininosuccinate synthase [Ignavibacteriales bacterium]|nr:argininosuccinate synthase [Ignavibacteriales bacterium]MCB9219612.1 argininosuccinate synthase [Ignavibacteriales bacterium]MCB9257782.1 argininosuccinate synthase [Ignavibacteriales bacterium]
MQNNKIVVAYSGGLDTSVMVKWLSKKYNAEIITVTGNLGQKSELINLEEKALSTGASKAYIVNLQKEFIEDYAWKALKGGALYEGEYPLATAIGRPLLAKLMVEIAQKEGANMVAHGCTGKGNDQVRFEVGMKTLDPNLEILAPLREWEFKSREEEIEYAKANDIPVSAKLEKLYSIDENIWGIATECGILEDTSQAPPDDAYQMTINPKNAPQESVVIKITFEKGIPTKIDGVEMPGTQLVSTLNDIGGKHGIGRLDIIENRVVGIKSREVYEAPGAMILHEAHRQLEKLTLDKDTFRYKQNASNTYANLIYDGFWFTPLFDSLTAFFDKVQERVTGEVTLELYKGTIKILSRISENSLYSQELATYTEEDAFNHKDAEGFINITSLPHQVITRHTKNKFVVVKS